MTLNHPMMVERYPNFKEEVGGSIPGREISSPPYEKLARSLDCLLCFDARMSAFYLLQKKKERKRKPKKKNSNQLFLKLNQSICNQPPSSLNFPFHRAPTTVGATRERRFDRH